MQRSSGFLILLLIVAIVLSPSNSHEHGFESPQAVCGDSLPQSENIEDNESDGSQIIAVIIVVLIIIFIIYCITGSDNQSHERR